MSKVQNMLSSADDFKPEIVIGLVAKMGTNIDKVIMDINAEAARYNFDVFQIRVTDLVKEIKFPLNVDESNTYIRYTSLINVCNEIRRSQQQADIFAKFVLAYINKSRASLNVNSAHRGIVYVVNQLKTPEEIQELRRVYGNAFFAVSCYSPLRSRRKTLEDRFREERFSPEEGQGQAEELLRRDDKEEGNRWGQNVRAAFPLADFVLDTRRGSTLGISRLFSLIFGDVRLTPTFEEYANNLASQAAYRSADLSRQVGAAIFSSDTRIIMALGCNEVPKFGGGTYWEGGDRDGRDVFRGHDINTLKKRSLVIDIVERLKGAGYISSNLSQMNTRQLGELLLDGDEACLRGAPALDILEFGRALHAEMNALTDAARQFGSCQGAHMFVTTFPCHNCAKHIVGSGISRVTYLEPYPKSQVEELYSDSIVVEPTDKGDEVGKVVFQQFCGITKRRFPLFGKSELKDSSGKLKSWDPRNVAPAFYERPDEFDRKESETIQSLDVQFVSE